MTRPMTLEFYRNGCWSWRLRASNGQIVATPHESFVKRLDAVNNAAVVLGVNRQLMRRAVDGLASDGQGRSFPRGLDRIQVRVL